MSMDHWTDDAARTQLESFLKSVRHRLSMLPASERTDIEAELKAHVMDSLDGQSQPDSGAVSSAIARLGELDDFLPELIEDYRVQQRTRTGNPAAIATALARGIGRSTLDAFVLAGLGVAYLFTIVIIALGVYSAFQPDAGLWLNQGGGFTLSFEQQPNATQAFRHLFWLVGTGSGLAVYAVLTLLLRWWLRIRPR